MYGTQHMADNTQFFTLAIKLDRLISTMLSDRSQFGDMTRFGKKLNNFYKGCISIDKRFSLSKSLDFVIDC